ncbi:sodium- and chloride-dependent glycine transporter 1-like [Haliotis rufescens]|uniref:sodium- and chloride-dependent glycine transporter 1-like n=1 Tax=Haliotis rufescens TaxID=6454 RepID=UPI00201E8F42|nr:sodium- and chloride-dependent glycine transporter 1-like [Haliotis rufescens]
MMMTLGLDTTVPSLEITQETLADQFPSLAKRRWLLLLIVFLPCFLLALPYTTQGGIYALTLVDWYSSVPPVMLFGVVECLVLAWVFGVRRLDKCTLEMYGQTIPKWLAFLMKYITPGLLTTIFLYAFYEYRPPKYGDYFYPEWATVIGWLISLFMIAPTPCWMVYCVWKSEGDTFKQKLVNAFIPEDVPTDIPIDDIRGEQEALKAVDTSMSTHPL